MLGFTARSEWQNNPICAGPGLWHHAQLGEQAAMCAITTASGYNGACRLLRSAGDLVAESEHIPNLHY
ncbi:MAG TPA: hypothetical protein VGD83_13430 [Streptosporangiaceae bacterium]